MVSTFRTDSGILLMHSLDYCIYVFILILLCKKKIKCIYLEDLYSCLYSIFEPLSFISNTCISIAIEEFGIGTRIWFIVGVAFFPFSLLRNLKYYSINMRISRVFFTPVALLFILICNREEEVANLFLLVCAKHATILIFFFFFLIWAACKYQLFTATHTFLFR